MTKNERDNWIDSIARSVTFIEAELGPSVPASVYERFDASNIWELSDCDLPEVFSGLYAVEADLR